MLSARTLAEEIERGPVPVERVLEIMRALLEPLAAAHDRGEVGLVLSSAPSADLAYLAPECLDGEPATVRSELYAVGVMCYEALTGSRPFEGDAVEVAYAARHATLRPIRALRPDVPADLAAVVGRAMARLPDDRFSSASELADALEDSSVAREPMDAVDETVPVDVSAASSPRRMLGVRRRAATGSHRSRPGD